MRFFCLALCLAIFSCRGSEQTSEAPEINKVFDNYKEAILATKGEEAAAFVSDETLAEYQKYVDWALTAEREELQKLRLLDQMQVLIIRHLVPAEELRNFDGRDAFVYAVDAGLIGEESVEAATIADIQVDGNSASAAVVNAGEETSLRFEFQKQDGTWRFDLIQTMSVVDAAFSAQIKSGGQDPADVLMSIVSQLGDSPPTDQIWEPLGK